MRFLFLFEGGGIGEANIKGKGKQSRPEEGGRQGKWNYSPCGPTIAFNLTMNKSVCQSHSSSGKFDQKEYARKWRLAHKDYYSRYRERNWEKVREYEKNWKKKYCKQHPGKKREDWKKWLRAHPGWKRITEHGYLIVSCPSHPYANSQGMVYVHRLAAEKMLGRFLNLDEVVHHQDGNRLNNDPGNLMIMSAREHALLHASRKGGTKE